MGKICIRCGYERKEVELAPDTECPKCGVIYARVENPGSRPMPSMDLSKTPQGRARKARINRRKFFQIEISLSQTTGHSSIFGTYTSGGETADASYTLEQIESEGWHLIDAGYVFRPIGSASREKVIGSTEREAISGEIIGIYLFRTTGDPPATAD